MKKDRQGAVHCVCCYKLIKDITHISIDEEGNYTFLCEDCYEKLKPFFNKGRNR